MRETGKAEPLLADRISASGKRVRRHYDTDLRTLYRAVEQSPSTVVITDAQGNIEYVNPKFTELTGYAPEEVLGKNPRLLKSGEQPTGFYAEMWQTIAEGREWRGEFSNRKKDGEIYWEFASISAVRDGAGRVTHYVKVAEDITKRRRAEQALQQYARELEARNAELDAFAHTVAHDLKNPLSLVAGYAQMLQRAWQTLPSEQVDRYLHTIGRNARRMDNIIDELLLLAGVRKQEVEFVPLDVAGIVAEAQNRLTDLIDEYQAELSVPGTWPVALGHGPWVEEVWVNYLSNGIKYGGRPPRLELGAIDDEQGMVRFWVRDNGAGLTPKQQARLFVPFTQMAQVRVGGHGLGLSIVQRIVEKLGGQVGVESEGVEGQGSLFFFTLPAAEGTGSTGLEG
jgi:PAS domain S-box-containing protein